jgi:peptide chain release factor 3
LQGSEIPIQEKRLTILLQLLAGVQINLLDTPGHQDFSEDTYRTLAAADNAVMLVDGAKGIEEQTRKLFAVARLKGLPIFTFVNKMDRPALNGFDIIEQLEKEFGLISYPVTWPIGSGANHLGLCLGWLQGRQGRATNHVYK